jgi:hypothetical protein
MALIKKSSFSSIHVDKCLNGFLIRIKYGVVSCFVDERLQCGDIRGIPGFHSLPILLRSPTTHHSR